MTPWTFPKGVDFPGAPGEHIEDRLSSEAVKFIQANKDRPFYLNYWCFSVHAPWDGKKELIEQYRKKMDPKNPQHNPVYAAMVKSMDDAVGRLLKALEDSGVARNTMVVFFSDNGGINWEPAEKGGNFRYPEEMKLPITSNFPLRACKGTLYEGGVREPCIVSFPGVVKPGTQSEQILSSIDWHPTILELTGVKPQAGLKFDGISMAAALRGGSVARDAIFCHYPVYNNVGAIPGTWVRRGDWKLIRFWFDNDDQTDRFELYNLKADIGETKNLAASQPAKVQELNALIDGFVRDTHAVVPKRNPNYKPGSPGAKEQKKATILDLLTAEDMA